MEIEIVKQEIIERYRKIADRLNIEGLYAVYQENDNLVDLPELSSLETEQIHRAVFSFFDRKVLTALFDLQYFFAVLDASEDLVTAFSFFRTGKLAIIVNHIICNPKHEVGVNKMLDFISAMQINNIPKYETTNNSNHEGPERSLDS